MIRKNKNGLFYAACSECKTPASKSVATEGQAAWEAEQRDGFALLCKFHFCRECFLSMQERWNLFNKDAKGKEKEAGYEEN